MAVLTMEIPKENKGLGFLSAMSKDPLNFFVKLAQKSGSHTWLKMPKANSPISSNNILFLNDATGIQHVFQKNRNNYWKGEYNQVLKPIFGKGIFLAEGDAWKTQKKLCAPSFSSKHFPGMTEEMVGSAQRMFERLDVHAAQETSVDLFMEMMWYTIDVVLHALYHSSEENTAHDIKESLSLVLSEAEKRIWSPMSLPQKIVLSFPPYKQANDFLIKIVQDLIEAKKNAQDFPEDLLGTFMEAYSDTPQSQKLMHDQVMSFLLAGHETTANALIWTFYELSKRPDFQDTLRAEIDDVLGDGVITFEKVKQLKFARRLLLESLRLHPPVWSMSRASYEADHIPLDNGDEIYVPADTTVMMCTYAMHKNTAYWDNPEVYDPDRFLDEKAHAPFSFFPFGGGPRACMGRQFAEVESIIMMCMFLRRYDLMLVPGQTIKETPAITLKPDSAVYFQLKRRQGPCDAQDAVKIKIDLETGDFAPVAPAASADPADKSAVKVNGRGGGGCPMGHHHAA